jgi:hypothetical protein
MKIKAHAESHIVELDDGSRWQIFPGDIDITLHWKPETDLQLIDIEDDIAPKALIASDDAGRVRVLPFGQKWPADATSTLGAMKRGQRRAGLE